MNVLIRAKSKEVVAKSNAKDWPSSYTCNFLEDGIVSYEDVGAGVALLQKETIDKMLNSFIGKPVLVDHKNVSPQNFKSEAVGYVTKAYFNEKTGWFDCEFILINDKAKKLVEDGYSVSCSFDVKNTKPGGEWHAIKYDEEITGGEFQHLALVTTPRYEDCRIIVNSKAAKIREEKIMSKQNGLDIMSPLQRDKYLESLSDSGVQALIDSDEESKETKELATQHQGMRKQRKEEELLGQKPGGAAKEKKNVKENVINAEEAFVVINDKEVSVASLIEANNALNKKVNDLQEMVDPALKNKKCSCNAKEGDPHSEDCPAFKKNEAAGAETKKTELPKDADKKKKNDEKEEEEEKNDDKKNAKHFVRLNSLKENSEMITSTVVDTLRNKIERGNSRYGSK